MLTTPVSSISTGNRSKTPKAVVYAFILFGLILLIYFGSGIVKYFPNLKGKAVLSAEVTNGEAQVLINGTQAGKTPFKSSDIKAGENKITLKNDAGQYETTINFLANTEISIVRDLGISDTFSDGQNFWIEKSASGDVLSVISNPSGASVFIDGTEVGKTPYTSSTLSESGYELKVEYPGYEAQNARIKIQKGYRLNGELTLFPMPASYKVDFLEGSTNLYNVTSGNNVVTSNTNEWVKALLYWNKTRGINLAGLGVNREPVFDYFLDYKGNLYGKDGSPILNAAGYDSLKEAQKGAYLTKSTDPAGLSQQAKETYDALTKVVGTSGKKATVKETGTGWLRVRDLAGLNGKELAKVNVGESFIVLEEQTGWAKIKVSDTVQGWVSTDYVTIK